MTPTEQALARELARHPGWKWCEGMLATSGAGEFRITKLLYDATSIPDLSDPATQGCLIAALEPWLLDVSRRRYMSDVRWTVTIFRSGRTERPSAPTLGEAIARAWLAVQGGRDE